MACRPSYYILWVRRAQHGSNDWWEAGTRDYVLKEWPCSEVAEMSHAIHEEEDFSVRAAVVYVHFCEHACQVRWVASWRVRGDEAWYEDKQCKFDWGSLNWGADVSEAYTGWLSCNYQIWIIPVQTILRLIQFMDCHCDLEESHPRETFEKQCHQSLPWHWLYFGA